MTNAPARATIIAAFGDALVARPFLQGREAALPYPRDLIRDALLSELLDPTSRELAAASEAGYLELESFIPDEDFEIVRLVESTTPRNRELTDADVLARASLPKKVEDRYTEILRDIASRMEIRKRELEARRAAHQLTEKHGGASAESLHRMVKEQREKQKTSEGRTATWTFLVSAVYLHWSNHILTWMSIPFVLVGMFAASILVGVPFYLPALLGFSFASLAAAQRVYQIDLRGNARLLSRDRPVHKGRLALYADGVFLSVPEQEIVQVTETELTNLTSKVLLPGEAIDVGPTGGNDRFQETVPGPGNASAPYGPMTPGYYGYGGPPRRGPGAGFGRFAPAPPLAGPNGFPISPRCLRSSNQTGFRRWPP